MAEQEQVSDLNQDGIYEVAAIVGSLRRKSYNRGLLQAAGEVAPAAMRITEAPLIDLPLYNEDVEQAGDPEPVRALKDQLLNADAILIFAPEYNQGMTGVLKNALDWASRPYGGGKVLEGKPVAILGASATPYGTARAQLDLRRVLPYLGMYLLPKPEIYVGPAGKFFDEASNLIDEGIKERIGEQLGKLLDWTKLIQSQSE